MSAASHWPDDLDRKAMEGMAYADGTRIGRGDLVSVDGRPEAGTCEVIGFRPRTADRRPGPARSSASGRSRAAWS